MGAIMLNTQEKVVYKVFGLNVTSEISLPELPLLVDKKSFIDVDVDIKCADLTIKWVESGASDEEFFIKDYCVMFKIATLAIFSIQNGNEIIVSPLESFSEDAARLYILGTCMGTILFQRKILPLHGSAIVIDGKAYGFVGDSGAGKSTLSSAFINKGYPILTDDVIAVTLSKSNSPIVTPSYPQQKLWQESLDAFGMDYSRYSPLLERETKYAVPVPSKFTPESYPLAGIFELVKTENEEIGISPIKGFDRMHTMLHHTYRSFIVPKSGLIKWHFNILTQIINNINFYQLCRPVSRFTADELTSLVLNKI
jgi:hypothetical protein